MKIKIANAYFAIICLFVLNFKTYKIENAIKRNNPSDLTIVASATIANEIKINFLFSLKNKTSEIEINNK